ncbi:M23 family metallopeptidase [candidate division KSB1 bacterium]|nr:M23 family metallopeptidase [candidate division KSB1 bacterium]
MPTTRQNSIQPNRRRHPLSKFFDVLLLVALLINITILVNFIGADWRIYFHYNYFKRSTQPIIAPIDASQLTLPFEDTFGAPREQGRVHQGIDMFCRLNTPIKNAQAGVIVRKGNNTLGGNALWILGDDNRLFYYAHLNGYAGFSAGDHVGQGEIIGFAGNSGNAITTPVHVHFEIMEIERLFPLKKKNINPFHELTGLSHGKSHGLI